MANNPISPSFKDTIYHTSHSFCTAFLAFTPPAEMLSQYFTPNPKITEHGPSWSSYRLPFLGKTFQGRRQSSPASQSQTTTPETGETCDGHYDLLAQTLKFHPRDDTIPPKNEWAVDEYVNCETGKGAVVVKLKGRFESVKTGKGWDEEFVYRLSEFDETGKIGWLELWADPLSAWVACGGGEDDS